jgi:Ca2+-binding EF-hand superfamily protein
MIFNLFLVMVVWTVASMPWAQYAYGHDCPLQQMERLETFRALDRDKDGRLDLEEFMAQGWCREVPACQCQEVARQFFRKLDQNQDGFITLEEHQTFTREKKRRQGP